VYSKCAKDMAHLLIECLLAIPFPYTNVLRKQINASSYTTTDYSYQFWIDFHVDANMQALPNWLDDMPLSWQIIAPNCPLLCQLFTKCGYIDRLEIINMAFSEINWEHVEHIHPMLDYEYDRQVIREKITNNTSEITKVNIIGDRIDWSQNLDGRIRTVSFRGCLIQKFVWNDAPMNCLINISEIVDHDYQFIIQSSDGNIEFKCAMIFLQWHRTVV